MIIRSVWIFLLIAIAYTATAFQLDRQARVSPAFVSLVPEPFRAFSQARITASALANGDSDTALKDARRLVRRRPIPAENLRLLAAAQFDGGMTNQSALTMQHAAKRGWRDPIPQQSMMGIAFAAGDEAEAARRFIALMLQPEINDDALIESGALIFAKDKLEGRKTLDSLVAAASKWQPTFVRRGLRVLPADAYVDALVNASSQGSEFDCGQLRASLQSLERRRMAGDAASALAALISSQCR